MSLSDSKYPAGSQWVFVPFEYDPAADELDLIDEKDMLHDPLMGRTR